MYQILIGKLFSIEVFSWLVKQAVVMRSTEAARHIPPSHTRIAFIVSVVTKNNCLLLIPIPTRNNNQPRAKKPRQN